MREQICVLSVHGRAKLERGRVPVTIRLTAGEWWLITVGWVDGYGSVCPVWLALLICAVAHCDLEDTIVRRSSAIVCCLYLPCLFHVLCFLCLPWSYPAFHWDDKGFSRAKRQPCAMEWVKAHGVARRKSNGCVCGCACGSCSKDGRDRRQLTWHRQRSAGHKILATICAGNRATLAQEPHSTAEHIMLSCWLC